jgi:hypothetical protein
MSAIESLRYFQDPTERLGKCKAQEPQHWIEPHARDAHRYYHGESTGKARALPDSSQQSTCAGSGEELRRGDGPRKAWERGGEYDMPLGSDFSTWHPSASRR